MDRFRDRPGGTPLVVRLERADWLTLEQLLAFVKNEPDAADHPNRRVWGAK